MLACVVECDRGTPIGVVGLYYLEKYVVGIVRVLMLWG